MELSKQYRQRSSTVAGCPAYVVIIALLITIESREMQLCMTSFTGRLVSFMLSSSLHWLMCIL